MRRNSADIGLVTFKLVAVLHSIKASTKMSSSWKMGLISSMNDPAMLLISSDCGVVIQDKYPKAKHHFLVLPKTDIPSIYHVRASDLNLMDELHLLGVNAIEVVGMQLDHFKIGFHAVPSMQRLHLHVISKDFHSSCLKTKKHWNSFNTDLFLTYDYVYKQIREKGSLTRLSKDKIAELTAKPLICNQCEYVADNIPKLKSHLVSHIKS